MSAIDELILRATKEVVVKFIEVGRVSPTSFPETFQKVYTTIRESVNGEDSGPEAPEEGS